MDNEEQIKKLKYRNKEYKKLIEELQSENTMLWDYLEEIRGQEKQLMSDIGLAINDYLMYNMKPIGDT